MAYNLYPNNYPISGWYSQFYQPVQPPMQIPAQNPQQTQQTSAHSAPVQGGFVRVQSEQEARAYPVAPGNSITFIDENAPYCYTKSMDLSQLDRPKFDKYRLVKEEDAPERPQETPQTTQAAGGSNDTSYALKSDLDKLWAELEAVKRRMEGVTHDAESAD